MSKFPFVVASLALALVVLAAMLSDRFGQILRHVRPTTVAPAGPTLPERPPPATAPDLDPATLYTTGPASRGGTGRFYFGREIAQVMGHQAIRWLERPTRESEESPSRATANLQLAPDAVIADIGAGSGYYSFRLAELVPQGRVVAIDIQPEMIADLERRKRELGVDNIDAHLGITDGVQLPENTLDAALMVDAYHEFSHPYEMMRSLHKALRPGGRIFLLEYRAEDPKVLIKRLHKMSQEQTKTEMSAAGFRWVRTEDFLPMQHFMVFEKPE